MIAGMIALSISIKIMHKPPVRYEEMNPLREQAALAALKQGGFQIVQLSPGSLDAVFGGQKDSCVLWLTWERPEGTDTARHDLRFAGLEGPVYLYRGNRSSRRPVVFPFVDWYLFRAFRALGFDVPVHTIFRLDFTPNCDIDRIANNPNLY